MFEMFEMFLTILYAF